MASLKVYNKETQQWEVVSTTDASLVGSRSETLAEYLNKESDDTNVQEVLEKIVSDVKLAKGNISWLALHGGGGSGGGGGSTTATGTIKVNGFLTTGATIVRKDEDELSFIIEQDVTSTWNYTVNFGNRVIKTGTTTGGKIVIANSANPLVYTAGQGILQITCSCGLSNIYWNGTIIKNTLTLSANEVSTSVEDIDTAQIVYSYSASAIGEYTLKIEAAGQTVNIPVTITQINTVQTHSILVGDLYDENNVGSNTQKATLTKNSDETITISISHEVVITSDYIVISSSTLSKVEALPTEVPKNSTIPCVFTAFLTGSTYMEYMLNLNGVDLYDSWQTDGTFGTTIRKYLPTNDSSLVIGHTYPLIIKVRNAQQVMETATYYVSIGESASLTLTTPKVEALLSDFRAYGTQEGNPWASSVEDYLWNGSTPVAVTQGITEINPNILSGIKQPASAPTYFRLSNKAYGRMTSWKIDEVNKTFQEIVTAKQDYTINLCFKADYHSEDNRTIFQLGNMDATDPDTLRNGILVTVHGITIKGNNSSLEYTLEDNDIYNVDIVYKASTSTFKVYIDGVVTKASSIVGSIDFTGCVPYLGCSYRANTAYNFSDCQFYRIMFYSAALNDYDILINYLQNMSYTHFVNGLPDDNQILNGLNRNFIELDPSTGAITNSWFWNINSGGYSLSNFIINEVSEGRATSKLNPNIDDFTLPIPLLFIDLSAYSQWSWSNFTTSSDLDPVYNVPFIYYDQSDSEKEKIAGVCSIDIQGTSTLSNALKNLKFNLVPSVGANPNIFIPKSNWLPEPAYTLKADIVDSSHSLNASIGKFVNNELANSEAGSQWFPLRTETLTSFKSSEYYTQCSSSLKPTLKTAVEGFPIFLIIRFYDSDPYTCDVRSLGVYQFILGRDSVHNLGLKILNKVKDATNTAVVPNKIPYYQANCTMEEADTTAFWVESGSTFNSLSGVDLGSTSLNIATCNGLAAVGWQSSNTMIERQFEVKYGNAASPLLVPHFQDLIHSISKAPACLFTYFHAGSMGNTRKAVAKGSTFPALKFENNQHIVDGTVQVDANDDAITINNYLDLVNAYKYAILGLTFGLKDNFCKNQPFILFDAANNQKYRLTLYDMDTGCGGDNNGNINTPTHLYLKGITNDSNYVKEAYTSIDSSVISGVDNKLWLSLEDESVAAKAGIPSGDNPYSHYWRDFRNTIALKYQSTHSNLADYFVDNYFIPQTAGCGELLFNLTYQAKYLDTAQASYLTGRRTQQVRAWLRQHIDFLDSVASWKSTSVSLTAFDRNELEPLRLYSKDPYSTIPVKYNESLIIKTTDQGGNYVYPAFCKKNTETTVRYGGGTQVTDAIQKTISWSNNLLKIGNDTYPFGNSGFQDIDANTLYAFNTLDLKNCTTIGSVLGKSPINFGTTFYKTGAGSELRIIDLENARNQANVANIILDLANFTKLTDINIKNSSVSSLQLPSTPLVSLDITGSTVGQLNLSQQNLLTSLDLTDCTKLTSLVVNSCSNIATITGINGLGNLTSISIHSTAITTLEIKNCSSLTSIEVGEANLGNIVIENCPALTALNLAMCTSLTNIKVNNCPLLTTITVDGSNTWQPTLTTLNLNNTSVKKIIYGSAAGTNSYLDLSKFTGLTDFQIKGNEQVEYIRFANGTTAIPITHCFAGCSKLRRLYGHIVVTNDTSGGSGTFGGCTLFTIHGSTFKGVSITNASGVYKTPVEILGLSDFPATYAEMSTALWDDRDVVEKTNMDFAGTSSSHMFFNTSCTQFDVYYFLAHIGTITSLSYTFRNLQTPIFTWTSSADNSPYRGMFHYCTNLVSVTEPFYGSGGYYRIFSPTRNSGGAITADDGLFSPLQNATSIDWIASGTYIADNFAFRRLSGNYSFTTINYFTPVLIVEDVNTMSFLANSDAARLSYVLSGTNYNKCGSLRNFFQNIPSVSNILGLFADTFYVNYGLSVASGVETFNIPNSVSTLQTVLRCKYATGELKLPDYFTNNTQLVNIYQSFMCTADIASASSNVLANATFNITATTFSKFGNRLQRIGYNTGVNYAGSLFASSFGGYLDKTIQLTPSLQFPYTIFSSNTNLKMVSGLFNNAKCSGTSTVSLPGTLFASNPLIEDVSALFYNFRTNYTLTSQGFATCTGLKNVSYLFAQDSSRTTFYLQGSIPYKLFYHGNVQRSKTIYGSNTNPEGQTPEPTAEPATVTYNDRVATKSGYNGIEDISYCFQRNSLDYYTNPSNIEIENNQNYAPWHYVKNGNIWSESTTWGTTNNKLQTMIWSFDGVNLPASAANYENLDEAIDTSNYPQIPDPEGAVTTEFSTHYFCCPPDLLRYCAPNANVNGLFAYSGVYCHQMQWESGATKFNDFGMRGRIPPYLLKPVYNTTSVKDMFRQCKLLSAYKASTSNTTYKIPQSFFSYATKVTDLSYTFSGMIFESTNSLNVFGSVGVLSTLLLDHTFYLPYFAGTQTITGIFTNKGINSVDHCFAIAVGYTLPESTAFNKSQTVTFSGIFTGNKVSSAQVGGHYTDGFCFAGYNKNSVSFGTKTLPNNSTKNNYQYSDGSQPAS